MGTASREITKFRASYENSDSLLFSPFRGFAPSREDEPIDLDTLASRKAYFERSCRFTLAMLPSCQLPQSTTTSPASNKEAVSLFPLCFLLQVETG